MQLSIKQIFTTLFCAVLVVAVLLLFAVQRVSSAGSALQQANETRQRSYLLADELRQSSDDLTRLARTYVVSGDPRWESQYFEVLDIRNGKKPRPQSYERIYWDFRAADDGAQRPGETAVPLQDLMKAAGFSDEEFAKLKEAQQNSNDLVKTETIAMNLVKGLYEDGQGGFTRKGEPDLAKARELMHNADYHRFKAKIMKPVDEFFVLLDARTSALVQQAQSDLALWVRLAIALAACQVLSVAALLLWGYRRIMRSVGAEPATVQELLKRMAGGDLSFSLPAAVPPGSLMTSLGLVQQSLSAVVQTVLESSNSIATGSSQISSGNADLSQRTEEQAASLQQTAASMQQLTATVQNSAATAKTAAKMASEASDVAAQGGAVVTEVVGTMEAISQSSRKISDIIGVIDSIAFQTNILALNAAVEAARAGDQGRGFAVVAGEVRNLAQRSAEAAKDIKKLIQDSVDKVESGSVLVSDAGRRMSDIVAQVKRVTDMIDEISVSTEAQTSGMGRVGEAVANLDHTTQQNASLVDENASAASSLADQAAQLLQAVRVFKVAATH